MEATGHRHVAGDEHNMSVHVTRHSNPFMSLTAVDDVDIKMDSVNKTNRKSGHYNPFLCEEETVTVKQYANETSYVPSQPKLTTTNPFIDAEKGKYDFLDCGGDM